MLGFLEVVQESWNIDIPDSIDHLFTLHIKLNRVAKALRS
jgi:hypothetical protein